MRIVLACLLAVACSAAPMEQLPVEGTGGSVALGTGGANATGGAAQTGGNLATGGSSATATGGTGDTSAAQSTTAACVCCHYTDISGTPAVKCGPTVHAGPNGDCIGVNTGCKLTG